MIAVGAFALGLQLVGYVNVSSNGSPLSVLIGASGLGLLISTWWAASLRVAPVSSRWAAGTSLPTAVLGSLATFFLSYATPVLGLVHGWFAVKPSDVQHTVALLQISWLAAFPAPRGRERAAACGVHGSIRLLRSGARTAADGQARAVLDSRQDRRDSHATDRSSCQLRVPGNRIIAGERRARIPDRTTDLPVTQAVPFGPPRRTSGARSLRAQRRP